MINWFIQIYLQIVKTIENGGAINPKKITQRIETVTNEGTVKSKCGIDTC